VDSFEEKQKPIASSGRDVWRSIARTVGIESETRFLKKIEFKMDLETFGGKLDFRTGTRGGLF
jgi:hypothetical protein